MGEIVRFDYIGICNPEFLSPQECRLRKSSVQLYRFTNPFSVCLPGGVVVTIPRGFVTDFGSVPSAALWYVGTETATLNYPASFHDYLYSVLGQHSDDRPAMSREQVDQLFHDLLLAAGMRSSQAWLIHRAVRLFGGSHWVKTPLPAAV